MESIIMQNVSLKEMENMISDVIDRKIEALKSIKADETKYLTRKEAAQMLHISLPTLAKWTQSGALPATTLGIRVLYSLSDLKQFLERKGGRCVSKW